MIKNEAEIKEKADILKIAQEYLPNIQNAGAGSYKACCPFHSEKTPSFFINTARNFFNCFGCGKGGDSITFLKEIENIGYKEALEKAAQICNVKVEIESNSKYKAKTQQKLDIETTNERLNTIFKNELLKPENAKILQYLFNRGLNREDLESFDIGLIPPAFKIAQECEKFSGIKAALDSSILIKDERNGGYYSSLSFRISFALRNAAHKVAGFSARSHPYHNFKNDAKYINSKKSEAFDKSRILYNLSRAKSHINKTKTAFICEGFFDCIAFTKIAHLIEYKNEYKEPLFFSRKDLSEAEKEKNEALKKCIVASCGTAFNSIHLAQLEKINNDLNIVLVFDNDEAGKNAAFKASDLLLKYNYYFAQVGLIQGDFKDFGEILEYSKKERKENKKAELLIMPLFKFWLLFQFKAAQSPKAKNEIAQNAKKIIFKSGDYFTKDFLLKQAQEATKTPRDFWLNNDLKEKELNLPKSEFKEQIFKTILSDKNAQKLAFNFLDAEEFEELKDDYLEYSNNDKLSAKAAQILAAPIECIEFKNFSEALRALRFNFLQKEKKAALNSNNLEKVIKISEYLRDFV